MRMKTSVQTRSKSGRWIAAALLAAAALVAPSLATAASADVVSGNSVWIGASQGYGGTSIHAVYETKPADPANPGPPDYWAYCVEHNISAKSNTDGNVSDLPDYLGANHLADPNIYGQVIWILAHGYPALDLTAFGQASGAPGISQNDAIEAAQYAIWTLTEYAAGTSLNWGWTNNNSETAYHYLLDGARASAGMSPGDFGSTVSITPPAAAQTGDSLVGPFTVSTDNAPAKVTVNPATALVDQNGAAVDANAVVDGQQLYLDLRGSHAAGSATVSASVPSSGGTGKLLSVPNTLGGTPTAADHAQTVMLVAANTHRMSSAASVQWAAAPAAAVPTIGTTLVDQADGDHVLPANGGKVVDTVAYRNLTPGVQYTLSGELMRKSDGKATGIVGTVTFTPATADGTVDVTFTVPKGHAGESLVAFEHLFGPGGGTAVAEHVDINDAAQTVRVERAPTTTKPSDKPGEKPRHTDRLPETGAPGSPLAILILAAVCLAAGTGAIAAGRRTRRR